MAVEKLASGRIFVGAPYKRTAAENYVSMFTKSRAEEFERAQKDARDELELKTLEYKAQLAAYQERIKSAERMRAKLQDLRTRTQNKEIDDATALLRLEATLAEKYAGREDAMDRARAEVRSYTTGSTTTTETSGGFGGGGGGLPDLSPSASTQQKIDTVKSALGSQPTAEAQVQAIVRETGPQGMLTTEDPNDRRRAVGQVTERLAKEEEGKLIALGIDPATARSRSRAYAKGKALEVNPALGADIDRYYGEVDAVAAATAGGGGGGTRTTTSERDVGFYSARPGLGGANVPGQVDLGPPPSREQVLAAIDVAESNIQQAGDVPRAPVIDPFTRGRTLYSERFGPSVAPFPFEQRRALDILRGLPPEMQASIGEAYRKYLQEQEARTAPTTPTVPTEATVVPAAAPAAGAPEAAPAPAVPPAPGAPAAPPPEAEAPVDPNYFREPILGFEAAPPRRFSESGMGETFPYEEAIRAAESGPQRPPTPPPPPPEPEDPETIALRKRAMAAARAREVAAKKAELQALVDKREADRSLVSGMLSPLSGLSTTMPTVPPMTAPGGRTVEDLSFADRPRFAPPQAAPAPPIGIDTSRAAELALLGVKPEGELMATPAPTGPSAAMAAPKAPAAAPPGYLKAKGPLATKSPEEIEAETDEKILRIAEVMQIQKQLVSDPKFLERTLKTKPGELAARVYRANAEAKKGLNATQNALVDEFMGNTDDMKVALAVAYALDSLSKPKSPADALQPTTPTPTKRVPFGPQE